MAIHTRLFSLLLFFLPIQLGFHFWPLWSFVLGRRVDYLSPTIFFTDILVLGTLLFWVYEKRANISSLLYARWYLVGFFCFTLFACLNSFLSTSFPVAIYKWIKVFEYIGLGIYIVSMRVRMRDVVFPLSLSVGYSAFIAIVQFILQRSIGGYLWVLGERLFYIDTPGIARFNICTFSSNICSLVVRPYATFSHPNVLAGYLAVISPILIYHILNSHETRRRFWIHAISIVLGCIALLFTFSRSAWVVMAMSVCVLIIAHWRKSVLRPKKILSRVFVIIGCILFLGFSVAFITFIPSVTDESVVRRVELQQAAVSMWQQSPIIGVGLGNFLVELPHYTQSRQINFLQPVHNIYILALSELGLIGLLSIILLFIWVYMYTPRIFSRVRKHDLKYLRIYTLPVLSILLLGLVDHYPLTLQQGQLLFTVFTALYFSSYLE